MLRMAGYHFFGVAEKRQIYGHGRNLNMVDIERIVKRIVNWATI